MVPVAAGVRVETMTLPFLGHVDLGDFSYPLTVVGIVAVMNIVNFIDGVDGLAAGVCTIAALTFAVIALSLDRNAAGVLAMLTAGAALGYLRHGFHPASIFLGDSGSNLLGYMLAAIAVQGALKTNAVVALVFPLLVLAVPILDSSFVIAKRIKYGQPVYQADRWHFHHRFANIGFSQRRTVLYLYGWTMVLAMLALALRFVPYSDDHGNFDSRVEPRDRRLRARGGRGQRLPGARARDPEAEALSPVPAASRACAARRAAAGPRGGRRASRARARDRGVRVGPARRQSRERPHRARHRRVHLGRRRGHMLVNLEPDDPADPHTFELTGELRDRVVNRLSEGDRVEVDFKAEPYEVLDPDSGPSESLRAEVVDVRVVAAGLRRLDRPAQLVHFVDGRAYSRRLHRVGVVAAGVGDDVRDAHRDRRRSASRHRSAAARAPGGARDGCRRRTPRSPPSQSGAWGCVPGR